MLGSGGLAGDKRLRQTDPRGTIQNKLLRMQPHFYKMTPTYSDLKQGLSQAGWDSPVSVHLEPRAVATAGASFGALIGFCLVFTIASVSIVGYFIYRRKQHGRSPSLSLRNASMFRSSVPIVMEAMPERSRGSISIPIALPPAVLDSHKSGKTKSLSRSRPKEEVQVIVIPQVATEDRRGRRRSTLSNHKAYDELDDRRRPRLSSVGSFALSSSSENSQRWSGMSEFSWSSLKQYSMPKEDSMRVVNMATVVSDAPELENNNPKIQVDSAKEESPFPRVYLGTARGSVSII
ncbi:MAG: hypothetical protein SGCHY_001475 [Lobulomycetales sp.]